MNLLIETFAAERRDLLDRMDEAFGGPVQASLYRYLRTPDADWQEPIRRTMSRLWREVVESEGGDPNTEQAQAQLDDLVTRVTDTLEKTTQPAGTLADRRAQEDRIVRWLSTATVNSATIAAAMQDGGDILMEWVTMGDQDVRDTHRPLNGQQVPFGETFDVAGHDLHYPGEPVGPPEVWINCRCVLRPAIGGEEMAGKIAFATEPETEEPVVDPEVDEDEEIDPDAPVVEDGIDDRVPFHGVLAPLGALSGDRRRLSSEEGAITWRDGAAPVVLRRVKQDTGGHMGATRVAVFDRIWVEDGVVKAEGYMSNTPEAQETIDLLAEGAMGVSIDLDNMVASYVNEDGSDFDFDLYEPGDPEPVMEVTEGRISAATIVDIPAFQEAYIALGTWEDAGLTAACIPCEAAAAVEAMSEEERAEFEQALVDLADPEAETSLVASIDGRPADHWLSLALLDAYIAEFAPGTKDGPGWITNPKETQRLRHYWTKGAGAAKIRWGQPGDFNRCRRQLAKYVKNPRYLAGTCANLHKVALGVWPGQEKAQIKEGAIMASAFTLARPEPEALVASARPAEWFSNPGLTAPTAMTVDDDGRVYGHIATWNTCHIGQPEGKGTCTLAPRSQTDYAYFKTGVVRTAEGDIPVGHITMGTGHAGLRMGHARAAAHYDNTGSVIADITVGEDEHGIWFSGALRPNVTDEQVDMLRAAAISGDWRGIRGNSELVAALAVNVPGFPIPRTALAASADQGQYALVAAGVLWTRESMAETFDVERVAEAVVERIERRERTKTLRASLGVEIKSHVTEAAVVTAQRLAAVRAALR